MGFGPMNTSSNLVGTNILGEQTSGIRNGRIILRAKDKPGIHNAILKVIQTAGYNVTNDSGMSIDGYYLIRNEFSAQDGEVSLVEFEKEFRDAVDALKLEDLSIRVIDCEKRKRAVVMVSEITYCFSELLHHLDEGDLKFDIACVVSNSRNAEHMAKSRGIDFHYIDAGKKSRDGDAAFEKKKRDAENEINNLTSQKADFYILAKWHRILLPDGPLLSNGMPIMSVHPSLLPAFVGGHAIRDAYQNGVKVAGATAHLVTKEDKNIDEGPKLVQIMQHVGNLPWEEFEKNVQFAEREAIYRAAKIMAEDRCIIYADPSSKTRKTFII